MTSYQGPHVAVEQKFETSPGAIAIENLPPTVVASAFDVFSEEALGTWYGIIGASSGIVKPWEVDDVSVDKVVYDKDVIDQRAYDFYPVNVYASSKFGNIEVDKSDDLSSTGITFYKDDDYKVPNTEKLTGASTAILPYYKKLGSAGDVQISASALDTVSITGGAVVTAKIQRGQHVFTTIDSGTNWVLVGTVGAVGTDETKIYLTTAYSAAITLGDGIVIGSAPETVTTITLNTRCDTLYDTNADFIANRVQVGDLVNLSSLSITGAVVASVRSIIDKNTIKFNTVTESRPNDEFTRYKTSTAAPGVTVDVSTYYISRFVGFSENYGLMLLNSSGGVPIASVNAGKTSFTIPDDVGVDTVPALSAGDIIMITDVNSDNIAEADMTPYKIDTITYDGTNYTITALDAMIPSSSSLVESSSSSSSHSESSSSESSASAESESSSSSSSGVGDGYIENGDFLQAWAPKLESTIASDFRAVRSEENQVAKRITSQEDIIDAWCSGDTIDVHNELAFMVLSAYNSSGGQVCYGINADATASSISAEYAACLEELKLVDVYSHCLGTTNGGINGLMSAYCDDQADPYEGHERTAVLTYDEEDAYLMGEDTGTSALTGVLTIDGAFNPITAGLTVGDVVQLFDSSGDVDSEATVTETPTSTTSIATDGTSITGVSFKFLSGGKDDQAIKIGDLGDISNRRITVIWPGWFYAEVDGDRMLLPPYYIAANICGTDSGVIASQSFTRRSFTPSGMSNIQLDTNTYFRKSQLDVMGGEGIDIMVQDASITQSIKSRHDLTTNMDAVEYRERSITKQADVAAKTIRKAIDPYVGRYNITPDLFKFIGQVCSVVSTKLVKDGILRKLELTSIRRDEVITDKINITMTATVFVAGNYYSVTLLVVSS